ncbi:MAG: glycosyltransferase family 2 protein [Terriglobales bacterium]
MSILFWASLAFLIYTFAGYPLALWMLSLFRNRSHTKAPTEATISLIVAAYNEASIIASKIQNCLDLRYPAEKREIIVASDGSTDETASIVRSFARQDVRLVEFPERRGKHHAQMVARDASHGEILVFSDSSIGLKPDALQEIVANFADPSVGCVSSEDSVVADPRRRLGEGSYIAYEMWLRRLESRVGALVGVSGSFFAARRELCREWHPGQSSDFFIPLHAAACGLRTVVDPQCVAFYGLTRSERAEFQRKVRTIVHGLEVLFTHAKLLNPIRYPMFSWQLASHKLFRWLAPVAALALLVSSGALWSASPVYRAALLLQAGLYAAGSLALIAGSLNRLSTFRLASFFVLGNAATLVAWWKFSTGEKFIAWEPTRRR